MKHEYQNDLQYKYGLDELGRPIEASGLLSHESSERSSKAQLESGGIDRLETDDGGHLIGVRFGGSGDAENIVPMDRHINRSVFKSLENKWADALDDGKKVTVDIQPYYSDNGERPSAIMAEYVIGDQCDDTVPEYFSVTNSDLSSDEFDISSHNIPSDWDGISHMSAVEEEFSKELAEEE